MDDESRRRDEVHRQALKTILDRIDEIHKFVPTVLATEKRVKEHEGILGNHERRIIGLEDLIPPTLRKHRPQTRDDFDLRVDPASIPPPSLPPVREKLLTIDPDRTPTGGFKLDPEAWQKILQRFEEQEEAARLAREHAEWLKEQNDAREAKNAKWKKRILFMVAVASPAGTVVTWALTHFFHL